MPSPHKFLKALFCFRLKWVEMRAKFRKYDYCLAKWNKFVSSYPRGNELCHFLSKNKNIFLKPKCVSSISNGELKCVGSIYQPPVRTVKNVFEMNALLSYFLFNDSLVLKWKVKQFIWKLILFLKLINFPFSSEEIGIMKCCIYWER